MKLKIPTKFLVRVRFALGTGMVFWLTAAFRTQRDPRWNGHRLSEWLEAHDIDLRFDLGDGRRSKFSDEEIEQTLRGIVQTGLPFLRDWLTAMPSRFKTRLDPLLTHQSWMRFRFRDENELQSLAEVGFTAYGEVAQPLLPELVKLSPSHVPPTRMLAFEAACFTRPNREVFLSLAYRALDEADQGVQETAALWITGGFAAEAGEFGLRDRFPAYFEQWLHMESVSTHQ